MTEHPTATDDRMAARLTAAGEHWRAANPDLAQVSPDSELLDLPHRRRRLLPAVGAAAAVAAIAVGLVVGLRPDHGSPRAGGTPPATSASGGLVGPRWLLTFVRTSGTDTGFSASDIILTFDGDTVGMTDACGTAAADTALSGHRIAFSGFHVVTADKCPPDPAGQAAEGSVLDLLHASAIWSVTGNRLDLVSGSRTLSFERQGGALPSELVGAWTVDEIDQGSTRTLWDPTKDTAGARLDLTIDGRFKTTGCLSSSGVVDVKESVLTFEAEGSDLCSPPAGSDTRASDALATLQQAPVHWSVAGGVLTLSSDRTSVIFAAVARS